MPAASLKDRLHPYFSVKAFTLTLGALLASSALAATALVMVVGHDGDSAASVTLPLAGHGAAAPETENPADPGDQQVSPGHLNESDRAVTEPEPQDHTGTTPQPSTAAATSSPAPDLPERPGDSAVKKAPAPVEDAVAGVHENTPFGMVPVIRKNDGLTAYKAYKAEFSPAADTRAIVSLVMVDYGLSAAVSEKAIAALPPGVTFALSPYSGAAQKMATAARQGGHEVWLSLPIQHQGYGNDDTGSQSILVNASIDQNKARLLTSLGKATGYAGVIDLDTPAFQDAAADLESIYSMIADRGLAMAQANPKDTVTGAFAVSRKVPFIQNDVWIDAAPGAEAVAKELDRLKQLALNGNIAVGFFHPYPAVLEAIKNWGAELATEKIEMAPLSAAIEQKTLGSR